MISKLALDTNCIIDLEENRPDAAHLKSLVAAWKGGRITLGVIAVSASENQLGGDISHTYETFERKIKLAGLKGSCELQPMMYWDFGYWDHSLWASDEMEALVIKIKDFLFPGVPTSPPTKIDENSVWRNQMCDVLVAWSCIHHKWDYLITRDANFHKHKGELAALGLPNILFPKDAATMFP